MSPTQSPPPKPAKAPSGPAALLTLPGDEVRQLLWRFSERYELQMLVQAARQVARGPVARLVSQGARKDHEWTKQKGELLKIYDESGITAAFLDPRHGGMFEGPKNLAMALTAFELAWVDGGAATASLAGNLGLAPIHECGTPEQVDHYMGLACPPKPGEDRATSRAAFALTEPLPYAGVETGLLCGKIRVAEWLPGQEPMLEVEKRGRFITNMDYANFITAAVDTDDPRIKSSCMVILEEGDPGVFDRGAVTMKLVHQLSSTRDPIFQLKVPASRIVGGYTIKDGVIIPKHSHSAVIEAVFKRTRITVGLMTSAKLLSAVEPVIRYQRGRFRGGSNATPGTPRFDLGIQSKQDALHRLTDIWAMGEAGASLGFATARLFDELDPQERVKDRLLVEHGATGPRAQQKVLAAAEKDALDLLRLRRLPAGSRNEARVEMLESDFLVRYCILDAMANVLCPATKLWNTGQGGNALREAVSLMGGYGITEDCPGFLGYKWMDAQLEATYEGPEAVQRRQLSVTMDKPVFLEQMRDWVRELRHRAGNRPETGACMLASAMELWLWTMEHLQGSVDGLGAKLYQSNRQGVTFPLADALSWLLASRFQIDDVFELEARIADNPGQAEGLDGTLQFLTDLAQVQAARAAGEAGRICADLVFGYNCHPYWDQQGCQACYDEGMLRGIEELIPGFEGGALGRGDVLREDQSHLAKRGPCAKVAGLEPFLRMHAKLLGCLSGSRLAKDRAANSLSAVMIPEALDYPRA
jgi:alkylation response protein AidB-like acyl-CoA dehydrogenase